MYMHTRASVPERRNGRKSIWKWFEFHRMSPFCLSGNQVSTLSSATQCFPPLLLRSAFVYATQTQFHSCSCQKTKTLLKSMAHLPETIQMTSCRRDSDASKSKKVAEVFLSTLGQINIQAGKFIQRYIRNAEQNYRTRVARMKWKWRPARNAADENDSSREWPKLSKKTLTCSIILKFPNNFHPSRPAIDIWLSFEDCSVLTLHLFNFRPFFSCPSSSCFVCTLNVVYLWLIERNKAKGRVKRGHIWLS